MVSMADTTPWAMVVQEAVRVEERWPVHVWL